MTGVHSSHPVGRMDLGRRRCPSLAAWPRPGHARHLAPGIVLLLALTAASTSAAWAAQTGAPSGALLRATRWAAAMRGALVGPLTSARKLLQGQPKSNTTGGSKPSKKPKRNAPAGRSQPTTDVWIIAGASNAWGDNGYSKDSEGLDTPACMAPRNTTLMYDVLNQTWVPAQNNVHSISRWALAPDGSVGVGMPFANALQDLGVSKRVGLIPCAMGGTTLLASWRPGAGHEYGFMVNTTLAAMARAPPGSRLRGIVMVVGEADALSVYNNRDPYYNPTGTLWSFYFGELMTEFLNATQAAFKHFNAKLPLALAVQTTEQRDSAFPFIAVVRDQSQRLEGTNLLKADMAGCEMYLSDLSGYNGYLGIQSWAGWQAVHLTRKGQCCLGARLAGTYRAVRAGLVGQG